MNEREIAEMLGAGATAQGSVVGTTWTCACGISGKVAAPIAASLALYFHVRSGHLPADRVQVAIGMDAAKPGSAVLFYGDGTAKMIEYDESKVQGSRPHLVLLDEAQPEGGSDERE